MLDKSKYLWEEGVKESTGWKISHAPSLPPCHPVLSSNTFLNIPVLVWFPGWHIFMSSWTPSITSWDRVGPKCQDWWNILSEGKRLGNPVRTAVEMGWGVTFIFKIHRANLFQEGKSNLYSREIIWHSLLFVLPKWWTDSFHFVLFIFYFKFSTWICLCFIFFLRFGGGWVKMPALPRVQK